MTGGVKKAYVDTRINEKHCMERLPGGLLQIKSDSQWLKDGVLVVKTGEEYTIDVPGMGKITVSYIKRHLELGANLGHQYCFWALDLSHII